MEANELRIGNYVTDVYFESFKNYIKVYSVNENGINLEIEDDGNYPELAQRWIGTTYDFKDLHPIPLTEEILLKCENFKRHSDRLFTYKLFGEEDRYLEFFITIDGTCMCVLNFVENSNCASLVLDTNIRLHELQNLIYSLECKELEIKL